MTKALLVYPEWPDTYWSFKHALPFVGKRSAYPPLGLLTIAPLLPNHWQKRLVDTNVRKLTDADIAWADVVLLSGMLVQKKPMLEILARCRKRGVKTIVGGPITSSIEEIQQHADHVVIGEAEEIIAAMVADIEAGKGKPVYRALALPSLEKTPLPEVGLISPKYYGGMAIQYSRGCPFNCEFCDIIEIYGRVPRTKRPAQVLAELDLLYDAKWRGSVFIVDDNFIGNKRKVKELLPALVDWNARRGHPFTFVTEASVNLADDAHLLQMMKDAGFTRVFLGIETPVESSLKEAQKMQNTRRSLLESVRRIRNYGMEVMAGFIVGFDNDPEDIFDKQVEFIEESAIPLAMVGLLQAVRGTQLYQRLMKEGRILHDGTGDNMDFRLNFVPKMSSDRLIQGYRSILQRIYGAEPYYQRVRRFLAEYHPVHRQERSASEYAAFFRSIVRQGILSRDRKAYWKFLIDAATHYRHSFDTAMTLAVMGYHFQTLTRIACQSD
jgi:radical SAM superfamily enzyme YgiQ (UPF0313 family)